MKPWLLFIALFSFAQAICQDTSLPAPQPNLSRAWVVSGAVAATEGASFVVLNQAWYKDYSRTSLHSFNDNREWLQVDKIGHAWTGYHLSRLIAGAWQWAGLPQRRSANLGAGISLLYMFTIEYLDGRSAKWGWSWGDVAADVFGASLFAGQEWSWKEQRLGIKFSAWPKHYGEQDLRSRADDLFGSSFQGRLLKDYNAQTYWLSANLKSFFRNSRLPNWLNVSVGYGSEGMFGGFENQAKDNEGNVTFDRRDIKRYRQWYLAPDIDFTKIETNSKLLRTIFSALNVVKFPAPGIEISKGKLKFKPIGY